MLKVPKPVWLILANTCQSDIYHLSKEGYFFVKELIHPDSRLKTQDLISDRPGHYKTSHAAHGQFISPDDAHEEEHKNFARKIVAFLKKSHEDRHFKTLIVCAEPHFYGLLKKLMPPEIQKVISKPIMKDYIPFPESKLKKIIEEICQNIFEAHIIHTSQLE